MPDVDPKCAAFLYQSGLVPACDKSVVGAFTDFIHNYCRSSVTALPLQFIGCYNQRTEEWRYYSDFNTAIATCMALQSSDRSWQVARCYTCCPSVGGTIATPAGERAMGTLRQNDEVLAGSLVDGAPKWTTRPLEFSEGLSGVETGVMAIALAEGNASSILLLSCDTVVVLATGKLLRANRLAAGDRLMGKDGASVTVGSVGFFADSAATHQVAVSTAFTGIENHLLATGGIVIGDYALQLHFDQLPDAVKAR